MSKWDLRRNSFDRHRRTNVYMLTYFNFLVLVLVFAEREEKFVHCKSAVRQNIHTSLKHQFSMNSFSKLVMRSAYRRRQAWRRGAETVRSDNVL